MAGAVPEERVTLPIATQTWRDMTFLHWPFEPELLQGRIPAGTTLDLWDGAAWVGLTPFVMQDLRVGGFPSPVPRLRFPETNLRTYIRGPDGRDGIWFLSLEAGSLLTTVAASLAFGVPYRWARMRVERQGKRVTYQSTRRCGARAGHRIEVTTGDQLDAGELDHWLTGRWRAWTTIAGRLADVPVEHEPWTLLGGTAVVEESLLAAAGLPPPSAPALVHASPGVDARLGRPRFRWTAHEHLVLDARAGLRRRPILPPKAVVPRVPPRPR